MSAKHHGASMNSIQATDGGLFVVRSGKKIARREDRAWVGLNGYGVQDNISTDHRGLFVTSPAGNKLSPIPPAERRATAARAANIKRRKS
jgi:hypothetical protein